MKFPELHHKTRHATRGRFVVSMVLAYPGTVVASLARPCVPFDIEKGTKNINKLAERKKRNCLSAKKSRDRRKEDTVVQKVQLLLYHKKVAELEERVRLLERELDSQRTLQPLQLTSQQVEEGEVQIDTFTLPEEVVGEDEEFGKGWM